MTKKMRCFSIQPGGVRQESVTVPLIHPECKDERHAQPGGHDDTPFPAKMFLCTEYVWLSVAGDVSNIAHLLG